MQLHTLELLLLFPFGFQTQLTVQLLLKVFYCKIFLLTQHLLVKVLQHTQQQSIMDLLMAYHQHETLFFMFINAPILIVQPV